MKKLILITLIIFALQQTYIFGQNDTDTASPQKIEKEKKKKDNTELTGPTKEQSIATIDKIVSDIKNEKETYRKIDGEKNIICNIKENVYKKDKEVVIIQIEDSYHNNVSDYYINRGKIVYMETKNDDNTTDKRYYDLNFSYLIADYRDGNEIDINYPIKERLQMGFAMQKETEELIKKYKKK